jgi:hypothetical protein
MRVLVCGGRHYADLHTLFATLDTLHESFGITRIINGSASGADDLSTKWAQEKLVAFQLYPAEWKKYGRSAGMIRNAFMFRDSDPDMVVAFPGGNGTENMVNVVKKAGYDCFLDADIVGIFLKPNT